MKNGFKYWRFFEILPGTCTWIALLLPVILSFIVPSIVAIYILIFDLYWLFRALYMARFLQLSHRRIKRAMKTDFRAKLEALPTDSSIIADWRKIYQVVIFATFREELETLEPSVLSVIENDWDKSRKIILLAGEERDHDRLHRVYNALKEKYSGQFFDMVLSEHPDGIAGEVRGKGAGSAWAGHLLTKYMAAKGIDEEDVLVTIADADTRFPRHYLNYIAYEFVINPDRHLRSFQPIPLYSNNIWHASILPRLAAWSSSIWQMIESSRPWRLVNFSTHSYSLKMLRGMDYWAVNVVNEDSMQFYRAYFAYSGRSRAIPIYMPVYLDAVSADSLGQTLSNLYLQQRRWAYGIEHFPYLVSQAVKHKEIPLWDRFMRAYRVFEGNFSWTTASMHLMFVGWLPIIFSSQFRHTVLAYNFPLAAQVLVYAAWIGLAVTMYVSLSFLPPRPAAMRKIKYLEMIISWVVMPVSTVFFSAVPAIDAQTRFMLGKYLTFWVTPKKTVKLSPKQA